MAEGNAIKHITAHFINFNILSLLYDLQILFLSSLTIDELLLNFDIFKFKERYAMNRPFPFNKIGGYLALALQAL